MTTEESDFWNDVHVSSGTVFQDTLGGARGRYFFYIITITFSWVVLPAWAPTNTQSHSCGLGSLETDTKMEFGLQDVYWGSTPEKGKGKKQDWAEGESELWCRSDKASASSLGSSGVSIAH